MGKNIFSKEDIEMLSKNKYVKNISEKSITYTNEFKIQFIADYSNGKSPKTIFEECGFDSNLLGKRRIDSASARWRNAYEKHGVTGLDDTRRNSGRPRKRELTKDDLLKKKDAEIAYLRAEIDLLKKLELSERQVKNDKLKSSEAFELIIKLTNKYNLKNMVTYLCEVANVSRSGYYAYIKSKPNKLKREQSDLKLKKLILKAFDHRGYKKGSRSIKMVLENDFNKIINRKCIQRIMRKYEIVCPHRKPNPYRRMAKATKEHSTVPNLLNRNFKQSIPGKVLLTDITYLHYGDGNTAYLSTIKDGSTNEILSYNLSKNLKIDIALDTIKNLMFNSRVKIHDEAIIHSDQGFHYTSPQFKKLLKQYNLNQSMSRRGNCWDNAPQESFFGHLKDEVDYKNCSTFEELKSKIDSYINYYNNFRYQWNLKKLTPVSYRNQLLVA